MKRPKKKVMSKDVEGSITDMCIGYNKCCDEWEEFLPDQDQILDIFYQARADIEREDNSVVLSPSQKYMHRIVDKILERLKGEE